MIGGTGNTIVANTVTEYTMGLVHASIKLDNPKQPGSVPVVAQALVDPARQELVPRDPRGPVSMAKGFAAV